MNDLLFANNNKKVLNRLAKADLKIHKLKAFLSGIIILIATCLMAVVFTVLINDGLTQANAAPYHAIFRAVNEEAKTVLLHDSSFETVGIFKNFGGTTDNGGRTNIAYMDPSTMGLLGYTLSSGAYPIKENEVAVSASYLENHKLSIGSSFDFSYTNALTNRQVKQPFTICGVITNEKQEKGKQFYLLTADSFRLAYAAQDDSVTTSAFSTQTPASVDVLLKLNAEKDKLSVENQKNFLKNTGLKLTVKSYDILLNHSYMEGFTLDPTVLVGIIFFAVFLMFASSIVIYSIFYISVTNSLPMYAKLMALGTTKKQLRYFLKRQGNILSVCFIPLGMLISFLITIALSGTEWIVYNVLLMLLSGLLVLIVVKISLKKPLKIFASLSPVEAMKYTGDSETKQHKELKHITPDTLAKSNLSLNRRKNRMSIVSLSVSGTLMIAFVILLDSINIPGMLMQSYPLNEDFQIGIQIDNFYERFPQIIRDNPLSHELTDKISSIPGVEKVIKDQCVLGQLLEPQIAYDNTEENMEIINSLSPELLANVSEVVSGSIEYEDIGMDGIIINQYRVAGSDLNYREIKTGDVITFQFHRDHTVIERDFRVIGIAHFPSTGLFYTTPKVLESLSPYDNTSYLSVFCKKERESLVQTALQKLVSENTDLSLMVYSEELAFMNYGMRVYSNGLYGVSIFILFFGLLNMINMLVNSALVRKREFALLQAVGMTSGQLRKMLYREGISISMKAVSIATIVGMLSGRLLCFLASEVMSLKFFIFQVSIFPILLFAILLIGLQMMVSFCICKSIEKDTLTERLRTE